MLRRMAEIHGGQPEPVSTLRQARAAEVPAPGEGPDGELRAQLEHDVRALAEHLHHPPARVHDGDVNRVVLGETEARTEATRLRLQGDVVSDGSLVPRPLGNDHGRDRARDQESDCHGRNQAGAGSRWGQIPEPVVSPELAAA